MKIFSTLFIITFLFLSFQLEEFVITENVSIEGDIYYWKPDKNNLSESDIFKTLENEKSFIKFENDSVFILDCPSDFAGMYNLSIGTYQYEKDKPSIDIEINEHMLFSGNIGWIVGYTKNLSGLDELQFTKEGYLKRKKRTDERIYIPINEQSEKKPIAFPDEFFDMLMRLRVRYEK